MQYEIPKLRSYVLLPHFNNDRQP